MMTRKRLAERLRKSKLIRIAVLLLVGLPVIPAGYAGPDSFWSGLSAAGLIFLCIWGALGTENVWLRQSTLVFLTATGFGVIFYVETRRLENDILDVMPKVALIAMLLPSITLCLQIPLWCIRVVRRARVSLWASSLDEHDSQSNRQCRFSPV